MKKCRTVGDVLRALHELPREMDVITATSNHIGHPGSVCVGVVTIGTYFDPNIYCLIGNGYHEGKLFEVTEIKGTLRQERWFVTKSGELSADGWSVVRAADNVCILEKSDRTHAEAVAALLNGNFDRAKSFL